MTITSPGPDGGFEQDWTREPTYDPGYEETYLSASRIKKFQRCPMSYKLEYIDGLSDQKVDKGHLALGSEVHESIETVLEDDPPLEAARLARDFKRAYGQQGNDIPESMYDDGLGYLDVAARYIDGHIEELLEIEAQMDYGLSRSDIDSKFFGYIDLTTPTKVIDWKTGAIRGQSTATEECIQGSIYMMGYYQLYGHPPEEVNFIHLKDQKERSLDPSDELWDEMIGYAAGLVQAIEIDDFPATPSDFCFFCGSEYSCPDPGAMGYGHVDWETF